MEITGRKLQEHAVHGSLPGSVMNGSGIKILIVDDDQDLLTMMAAALRHDGYNVRCAQDVGEAILMIRQEKPRFIVVDLKMPAVSGEELCRIVKEDPTWNDIILFVLSAKSDLETKLRCLEIGVEEYLVKPIHSRELSARIGHFLQMLERMSSSGESLRTGETHVESYQDGSRGSSAGDTSENESRKKFGNYRVESLVGKGGMGRVYKCYDDLLERAVAVKILARDFSQSEEFVARFRREAKLLASIEHPNIAFIYSFGEESGHDYFAMQWCSGGSVQQLLAGGKSLNPLFAAEIALQCARALSAASRKGVVHRDIKPSNLMFDENGQLKLVDFGLALSHTSADLTQTGQFMGTPGYIAPEQIQSSDVDFRADIYSLGMTFYQMLCGELPFRGDTPVEVLIQHVQAPFPAFQDFPGGRISKEAYKLIEKMTRKKREDRYQDYEALIRDLENLRTNLLQRTRLKFPSIAPSVSASSMREDSFLRILLNIREGKTGTLKVRNESAEKSFIIDRGDIIGFTSSVENEDIWTSLRKRGFLQDSETTQDSEEDRLHYVLLNSLFTLEEFQKLYSQMMKEAILDVFRWRKCEAQFTPGSLRNDAFSSISVPDILLEAARTVLDAQEIYGNLPRKKIVGVAPGSEQRLLRLSVQPEESFVLSRIGEGGMRLEFISSMTGLPEERVHRALFAFHVLGFLTWRDSKERAPRKEEEIRKEEDSSAIKAETKLSAGGLIEREPVRMEAQRTPLKTERNTAEDTAEEYYRHARTKFENGEYWQAANLCKQAIQLRPEDARFHILAAQSYAKHPRFQKEAESAFRRAQTIEPENPRHYLRLSEFYLQAGLKLRAAQECRKAIQVAPGNKEATAFLSKLSKLPEKS